LWVSGCADNAFSGLNFDDCSNAYGIRIDNSIDDRYSGTMLGDQPITVSDPNKRVEFDTQEIILSLDGAEDQEAFNTSLDNLLNIDQSHDVSLFMALFNACENPTLKLDDNAVFLNSENVNRLNYFGLKGYLVDQNRNPEYVNFKADDKQLDKNNADMFLKSTSTISIFNKTFIHNTELEQITLDKATCLESAGHTMFFKKPTYNSFSNINYIINGVAQVKHVLELRSREDDEDLCMDRADPNEDCEECRYEEHRAHRGSPVLMANAVGVNNVLNLCELPTDPLFVPFKNNYNRNGIIIPNCPDEYNKAIEVNIQN
ncbi:MAG: hypothetical protein KJN84_15275, partial [Bacteroidia bacterium]|nr:hypothetical protein [Bacteroidia bacterium]